MKMPTIVGIFIFISRENFMLRLAEHEKSGQVIYSSPTIIIPNFQALAQTLFEMSCRQDNRAERTDGRMNELPKSNMPLQLLSWEEVGRLIVFSHNLEQCLLLC